MANVILPAETYVDLYAATGIAVGVQIKVVNLSPNTVQLFSTAATPVPSDDVFPLPFRGIATENDAGDPGAWARSISSGAVDVKTA